jgi:hypothetical protein
MPTDAHVSHSRTVSGSLVDGHSAHGTDSRQAANTDSSAALRRWYGQLVVSVPDSRSRSNAISSLLNRRVEADRKGRESDQVAGVLGAGRRYGFLGTCASTDRAGGPCHGSGERGDQTRRSDHVVAGLQS